jgi:hypothetical protein
MVPLETTVRKNIPGLDERVLRSWHTYKGMSLSPTSLLQTPVVYSCGKHSSVLARLAWMQALDL